MTTASIVQLYPDELGVAGDRGNVLALAARLGACGIDADIHQYRRGDSMPPVADIVVIGSGPLSAVRNIYTDLLASGNKLRDWWVNGVTFFAYGAGAELLSEGIELLDGSTLAGLGMFRFRAKRVAVRKVGYIVSATEGGDIVGFEDNASEWILDSAAVPLGTVSTGGGNGDGREGIREGRSIATQIGGPVLPLNPLLTDLLVTAVARRVGLEEVAPAPSPVDEYARRAREVIVANAAHVFSRI